MRRRPNPASTPPPAPRRTVTAAGLSLVGYGADHAFGLGLGGLDGLPAHAVYGLVMGLVAVACLLHARRRTDDPRALFAWAAGGVSLLAWAVGTAWAASAGAVPLAGLTQTEILFLTSYVCGGAGLAILVRARTRYAMQGLWLEVGIATLGIGSLWVAVGLPPVLAEVGDLPVLHGFVYPAADLLLVSALVAGAIAGRRHVPWSWLALGGLCAIMALSDSVLAHHADGATYAGGHALDTSWALAALLLGLGAWKRPQPLPAEGSLRRTTVVLALAGLGAVTVLVVDHVAAQPHAAVAFSALTLIGVVLRFATMLGRHQLALQQARAAHAALAAETRKLRVSEARATEATRIARLGTWRWDPAANVLDLSEEFETLFGIPAGTRTTLDEALEIVHPEDARALRAALEHAAGDGGAVQQRIRVRGADGGWGDCHVRARVEHTASGPRVFGTSQDVTEAMRDRAALRDAEERLRHAFEGAPIGKAIVGLDGRWLEVNAAFCALLGRSRAELLERSFASATHPDDVAADLRALAEFCGGTRRAYDVEKRYVRRDGSEVWAHVHVSHIRRHEGDPGELVTQVQDITDRRRSEAALREAEQRFRLAFEEAPTGLSLIDLDGRRTQVNRAFCDMFGYAESELVGADATDIAHPDEVERDRESIERLLAGEAVAAREKRYIGQGGRLVWAHVRTSLVRDDDGDPLYLLTQLLDITERKRADAALRRLAAIVESSGDAIMATNRQGQITIWNPGAERLYGYRAEEMLGRPIDLLSPAGRVAAERAVRARVLAGLMVEHYETERQRRDGTTLSVSLTKSPIRDETGAIVGVSTITRDVSDRVAAQAQIDRLLGDMDAILASAGEGIYRVDRHGRITFANPVAAAMLGWPEDELLGRESHETLHHSHPDGSPYDRDECPVQETLVGGRVTRATEDRFFRRDGTSFPVDWTSAPVRKGSESAGAVIVFRDVSERVASEAERGALEERLRRVERLETVGQLAGGIAHDFNNLLAVISTYAALVGADVEDEDVRANVEQIRAAARTGAGLTRQLLIFGRRDIARDEPVDLNALVGQTEALLRRSLGERTTLCTALDRSLPPVVADRSQLEQLVLNLAINGRDAMPDGGTVTIATAGVDVGADEVGGLDPGRYVLLGVTDTGHGMDPEVVARAFEPFFTTKGPGQGTGLGLTTVYGIVTRAGGTVEIDSEPGHGTTVSIYLPAGTRAPLPAAAPAPAPPAPEGPPRRIMLVEDNDTVREATAELLRRRGHDVTAAGGADEALERVRAGAAVDVLLSDVVMPGLSGPELADQVRELRPGLPTVFMSGHTGDAVLGTGSAVCIGKPFDEAELLAALDRAIAGA